MNSREIDNRNLSDMEQYYLARIETLNNRIAELERALRAARVDLSKNQRAAGGYMEYLQAKYAAEGVRL